jgi:hypothetical protein
VSHEVGCTIKQAFADGDGEQLYSKEELFHGDTFQKRKSHRPVAIDFCEASGLRFSLQAARQCYWVLLTAYSTSVPKRSNSP